MQRYKTLKLLDSYRPYNMDEIAFLRRSKSLIQQDDNIFDRESPVHITASSWVVNPARDKVLLMHHRKLDEWLQPGGHADGDSDVIRVALRECSEETGLDISKLYLVSENIFDIDMHATPAMPGVPAHEHIDIRFLVEVDDRLNIPGNDESHAIEWFPLYEVMHNNNFRSTYRMLEKTRNMRNRTGWKYQNKG